MTRKECLDKAAECVLRDRASQYGGPEDCFETIAMMWSAYLGKIIQGWDVAAMMALLKIARIKANPAHADNWCDLAGYASCGAECRQKFEAEMKKTVEDAFETFPHLKSESNYPENPDSSSRAEGCEEPAYNPDNDVVGGVVTLAWPRGKLLEKRYASGRDEKCAEGCEELVQKDAPQTPAELYDKIIASNPATFGRPRTPTGEELAEMAEEDAHE